MKESKAKEERIQRVSMSLDYFFFMNPASKSKLTLCLIEFYYHWNSEEEEKQIKVYETKHDEEKLADKHEIFKMIKEHNEFCKIDQIRLEFSRLFEEGNNDVCDLLNYVLHIKAKNDHHTEDLFSLKVYACGGKYS